VGRFRENGNDSCFQSSDTAGLLTLSEDEVFVPSNARP
jgi:hypothetical protein